MPNSRPKRPIAVWIAQILLIVLSLMLFVSFCLALYILISGVSVPAMLVTLFADLVLMTGFIAAFWGMARRKPRGRWLGVVMLSVMVLLALMGNLTTSQGPIAKYDYSNSTELIAGLVTQIVINGLLIWLILHLSLARSVKDFFSTSDHTASGPPPPPTFDL